MNKSVSEKLKIYNVSQSTIVISIIIKHGLIYKIYCEFSHVEFGIPSENGQDSAKQGVAGCKLTNEQVIKIRDKFLQIKTRKLAEEYNVSRDIIEKIINRKSYKHVS